MPERIATLLASARAAGREALLETEGLELLAALGIRVPAHRFVRGAAELTAADLESLPGPRVVVKVVSSQILHKSDIGGVAFVARQEGAVAQCLREMESKFADRDVAGYLLAEHIAYDAALGGELLLGARSTDDFGPVVTLGPGGIYTEFLSQNFRPGRDVAILSPALRSPQTIRAALESKAITPLVTGKLRGQRARIETDELIRLVTTFLDFAARHVPAEIAEFEINPLVLAADRGPVALDVLVKLSSEAGAPRAPRPLHKLERLLEPRSAAVIGVSEKPNPGHIIVKNLLREGFPRERLWIIKPGCEELLGCRCVPDIASLPEPVDLFVLSIAAAQTPEAVAETIARRKAETMIVIPGGLGETSGSAPLVQKMEAALAESRTTDWGGPLINGGNCLGIRSKPGHYDTMFIPEHKLPPTAGETSPLALISQSGALSVARASKLSGLNPRYIVSIGNQIDLTAGDYLQYFRDKPDVEIVACYVEGFRPGDGEAWLRAAADITASGRTVILYRAGRTAAGLKATASHTASIAGDYAVTRELAREAGVVIADSLDDFEDLVRTFCLLRGKKVSGWRLGGVSNAGFECVGIADNIGPFILEDFAAATRERLGTLLEKYRLRDIIEVHNPMDLTPMLGDEGYDEIVRAILDDAEIDVAVVGVVPMTPALNTLAPAENHREDLRRPEAIAPRLARLKGEVEKAWVSVVDGGPLYDPLALELEKLGVPTFRTVDRAMRTLEAFCRFQLEHGR